MADPTSFGRYRVDRRIGSGAFATVWLAHDDLLESLVAVKLLADNWTDRLDIRQRFLDEARILRRADSDHVVRVHDIGEVDDRPYFVMTYADRGTLADRLEAGPLPVDEVIRVARGVAEGLAVLHRLSVVHRDVKPSNVLFRADRDSERVLLADLGLARGVAHASGFTLSAGTPGYMAPEQTVMGSVDERADVYALGALIVHAVTGRSPGGASGRLSAAEVARVPGELGAITRHATASSPAARYPSAVEMAAALRDIGGRPAAAFSAPPSPPVGTGLISEPVAAVSPNLPARVGSSRPGLVPLTHPAAAAWSGPTPTSGPGSAPASASGPTARPRAAAPTPLTSGGWPADPPPSGPVSAATSADRPRTGRLVRVRRRAWIVVAVAVAVLLAAAGGGGYAWFNRPEASTARVADASGHISIDVPATWREARIGGWSPTLLVAGAPHASGLAASPDLARWADPSSSTPGVFVGTTTVAVDLSDSEVLGKLGHPGCVGQAAKAVRTGQLTGTQEHWTCLDGQVGYDEVILRPADHGYVVYLQVKQGPGGTATASLLASLRVAGP